MKQYRTTIIAIVVIVIIVGAYFIVSPFIKNDDVAPVSPTEAVEQDAEKVFPINDSEEIKKYECNLVDDIVIERNDSSEWVCTTCADVPVNQKNMDSDLNRVVSALATVVYEGELTKEVTKNYEISETNYIKLTATNGKEYTLNFGMQKPGSNTYFAMVKENGKIYLMNTTYRGYVTISLENIIRSDIFNFSDTGKIKTLSIMKDGALFVELNATLQVGGRTWEMEYPLKRPGDDTHADAVVDAVTALSTMEYIEGDSKELEKYGLEVPKYVIILSDSKETQKFNLGIKNPEGNAYYCTIGDDNNVFTVASETLVFLDDTALKYMNTYIYIESYETLKSAVVNITCDNIDESFELGIEVNEDAENRYFNSQLMDSDDKIDAFKHLHTAIYELNIVGLEDAPSNKSECLISIKYTGVDGTVNIVEGYRRDDTTMYLYLDGEYTGGYEYIRQITGNSSGYGIVGSLEALEELM